MFKLLSRSFKKYPKYFIQTKTRCFNQTEVTLNGQIQLAYQSRQEDLYKIYMYMYESLSSHRGKLFIEKNASQWSGILYAAYSILKSLFCNF